MIENKEKLNEVTDNKVEVDIEKLNKQDKMEKAFVNHTTKEVIFEVLLPNMPKSLPTMDVEFIPNKPNKTFFTPNLNEKLLARRIYIEMLKTIRSYGELEKLIPESDKETITNLKNQMEILSLAMLNVYDRITDKNKVPFFTGGGTNISKNYKKALQQMYDKIYHIYNLAFTLASKINNEQIKNTLLIICANLKSQLNEITTL